MAMALASVGAFGPRAVAGSQTLIQDQAKTDNKGKPKESFSVSEVEIWANGESEVDFPLVGTKLKAMPLFYPKPSAYKYQWYRGATYCGGEYGTRIPNATESVYQLTENDIGKYVCVKATGIKKGYAETYVFSPKLKTSRYKEFDLDISGDAIPGTKLTAIVKWYPLPAGCKYQWYRDGKKIENSAGVLDMFSCRDKVTSYQVKESDIGSVITVRISSKYIDEAIIESQPMIVRKTSPIAKSTTPKVIPTLASQASPVPEASPITSSRLPEEPKTNTTTPSVRVFTPVEACESALQLDNPNSWWHFLSRQEDTELVNTMRQKFGLAPVIISYNGVRFLPSASTDVQDYIRRSNDTNASCHISNDGSGYVLEYSRRTTDYKYIDNHYEFTKVRWNSSWGIIG